MAEVSLPSAVDFGKKLPVIPDSVTTNLVTVMPTNGNSFQAGSVVSWDLPARTDLYIDPATMFFRAKLSFTVGAGGASIVGIPAVSFLQQLNEYVGSTPVNSVWNYGSVANMRVNSTFSVSDKYGQQSSLGFVGAAATPTLEEMEGRVLAASAVTTFDISAPLLCSSFASATNYIPTGLLGVGIRIQMTIDSLANFITAATVANVTGFTVTNFELCYNSIDMPGVDRMVASMGPKIYLKANRWANQANNLPSGTSGVATLPFNHRMKSVENVYCMFSGQDGAKDLNKAFDSRDPTSASGNIQLTIGQQQFPQIGIDTASSKTSVLQYLRECTGSLTDFRNSSSINATEFSYLANSATATTIAAPAKFIVGLAVSKIQPSPYSAGALLSGVDTSASPIILTLRIGSATGQAINAYMVAQYSLLLEIDTMTKQVMVIQ